MICATAKSLHTPMRVAISQCSSFERHVSYRLTVQTTSEVLARSRHSILIVERHKTIYNDINVKPLPRGVVY